MASHAPLHHRASTASSPSCNAEARSRFPGVVLLRLLAWPGAASEVPEQSAPPKHDGKVSRQKTAHRSSPGQSAKRGHDEGHATRSRRGVLRM